MPSLRWPCMESSPWAGLKLRRIIIILIQKDGEMKTQRGEETRLGSHSLAIVELRLELETASKTKEVLFLTASLGIPAKDHMCDLRVTLHETLVLSVPIHQMGGGTWCF